MKRNSPSVVRREVGRRIAQARLTLGWTQEALAEKVGVSTRYLQSVEGGGENLTLDSLSKFGNALRVRVAEFFVEPTTPTE